MCGIVGLVHKKKTVTEYVLERMATTLKHRGPDAQGVWCDPKLNIGLGHRRLSVIDLSDRAAQPMSKDKAGLHLVFNGEIYNFLALKSELERLGHTFRSSGDTEVLLTAYQEWGDDCVDRLEGMFAFAVMDQTRKRLFLARDRVGEKPLYFFYDNNCFAFASELKALLQVEGMQRRLDPVALNFYLSYGYVPGEQCILEGFNKLPPAHSISFDLSSWKLKRQRYWHLPPFDKTSSGTEEDLLEHLDDILRRVIRRQLVSDVPMGILLSGGVDSSLVTAFAAECSGEPVRTFTVSFPGHKAFDEGPYAKMVADFFGTIHTEFEADQNVSEVLPDLVRQFDEPLADQAIIPTFLVSRQIKQEATVALSGDGGDELFGGYPHYAWMGRAAALRHKIPGVFREIVAATATRFLPIGMRGRNHLIGLSGGLEHSLAHINLYFDHASRQDLLTPELSKRVCDAVPEAYKVSLCDRNLPGSRQAAEIDFHSTLPDGYLVKVDRASMSVSLEVRVPFLDTEMVEFAFSRVPESLKLNKDGQKYLLRRLAKRILPRNLDINRKQGFSMPLDSWFKQGWGDFVRDTLSDLPQDVFQPSAIAGLLKGQKSGRSNMNRLFALTVFELWRREYSVSW